MRGSIVRLPLNGQESKNAKSAPKSTNPILNAYFEVFPRCFKFRPTHSAEVQLQGMSLFRLRSYGIEALVLFGAEIPPRRVTRLGFSHFTSYGSMFPRSDNVMEVYPWHISNRPQRLKKTQNRNRVETYMGCGSPNWSQRLKDMFSS